MRNIPASWEFIMCIYGRMYVDREEPSCESVLYTGIRSDIAPVPVRIEKAIETQRESPLKSDEQMFTQIIPLSFT